MVDVEKKVRQISRGISRFGSMSNQALKRAALKKQKLERDMDRVFGPKRPATSGNFQKVKASAAKSIPSKPKTMDGTEEDKGEKTRPYFGDLDKDKLVAADMDGEDEGVKTSKFFDKDKKKGVKPW